MMEREIGALQARMETVEQELQAIRRDVREIRDALVTARGGWTTLSLVVGLSVSFGTLLGKFMPHLISITK
jgi:chromosome condensin MukBEF ATPase and DNA-binding subunit MukB